MILGYLSTKIVFNGHHPYLAAMIMVAREAAPSNWSHDQIRFVDARKYLSNASDIRVIAGQLSFTGSVQGEGRCAQ